MAGKSKLGHDKGHRIHRRNWEDRKRKVTGRHQRGGALTCPQLWQQRATQKTLWYISNSKKWGPEDRAEHGSEKIKKTSTVGEKLQLLSSWQKRSRRWIPGEEISHQDQEAVGRGGCANGGACPPCVRWQISECPYSACDSELPPALWERILAFA